MQTFSVRCASLALLVLAGAPALADNYPNAAIGGQLILPGAVAQDNSLPPLPGTEPAESDYIVPIEPRPELVPVPYTPAPTVELYRNVRYRDERKISPCAVPMIVMVPDPCIDRCDPCVERRCVAVKVCVPDCEPCIKVSRDGYRVKYDFGKYAVTLTSARGRVLVDYDR